MAECVVTGFTFQAYTAVGVAFVFYRLSKLNGHILSAGKQRTIFYFQFAGPAPCRGIHIWVANHQRAGFRCKVGNNRIEVSLSKFLGLSG
ncbi:hypothetical protein [Pseudoalteromonas rubra]|uniref:hypothetical protein n=1 Tax=Pseudoalteromonas rubra TaxID=43658 RepID=UPI003AF06A08